MASLATSLTTLQIVLLLISYLTRAVHAEDYDQEERSCPDGANVDLTYATSNASGFLTESGLFFPSELTRLKDGLRLGCICDLKPCLFLCPPRGKTKTEKTYVADDYANYSAIPPVFSTNKTTDDDEETRSPEERFYLIVWDPCPKKGISFLHPEEFEEEEYHLFENGSLFLPRMTEARILDIEEYCLQVIGNDFTYTPNVCSLEDVAGPFIRARYVGGLVAVPFLIATAIVYSVLPKLRNTHGKVLRCYLCCLAVTHVALGVDQMFEWGITADTFCFCRGFTIYFSFLASFFWLNVMCFNLWWTFRRCRGVEQPRNCGGLNDDKFFYKYSLYAWGIPAVLTAICVFMEFIPDIPMSLIRPGFELGPCWFNTKKSEGFYFYGPVGATIACNIFLFVSTLIKISQHNQNMRRHLNNGDSRRYDDNRKWFSLYLKFFVVMGISWSTEIISWLWEGPKYFWWFTDMVNALQGILIFLILVCRKNTWRSLEKRFNPRKMNLPNSQLARSICKPLKSSSESRDPAFIDDQKNRLLNLINIPHPTRTDGLKQPPVGEKSAELSGFNLPAHQNLD